MKANAFIDTFSVNCGKTVTIRYPDWSDIDALVEFTNSLSREDTFVQISGEVFTKSDEINYLSENMKRIALDNMVQLFVFVDGKLVGNASIIRERYRMKHVGSLAIAIADGYREMGIGKRLLQDLIDQSEKQLKLKLLTLTCIETNERALHVYQSLGFTKVGCIPKAIFFKGNYVGHIIMAKEL